MLAKLAFRRTRDLFHRLGFEHAQILHLERLARGGLGNLDARISRIGSASLGFVVLRAPKQAQERLRSGRHERVGILVSRLHGRNRDGARNRERDGKGTIVVLVFVADGDGGQHSRPSACF